MAAFHKNLILPAGVSKILEPTTKDTENYRYFQILKVLIDNPSNCSSGDLALNVDLFEIPEISSDDNKLMLNPEPQEKMNKAIVDEKLKIDKDMYVYALKKEKVSEDDKIMFANPEEEYKPDSESINELLSYLTKLRKQNCNEQEAGRKKQKTLLSRKKRKGKTTKRRKRKTKRNKSRKTIHPPKTPYPLHSRRAKRAF